MRKYYTLITVIFFFALISTASAQKLTKPVVVMDATYGYALPMFDFAGTSLKDFYALKGYGINGGYSATYTPKLTVANFQSGQVRTYLTISFTQFLGSEERSYNLENLFRYPNNYSEGYIWGSELHGKGWPIDTSRLNPNNIKDTAGTSSIRISSPYIAYGWEISLFGDKERHHVFNFSTDLAISVLWGKVFDFTKGQHEIYNSIIRNTRLGLGMNLSYSYRITNAFGFILGTRFNMTNLFQHNSDVTKADGDLNINDAANPSLNIKDNKGIGFFSFFAGASFYIAGKK